MPSHDRIPKLSQAKTLQIARFDYNSAHDDGPYLLVVPSVLYLECQRQVMVPKITGQGNWRMYFMLPSKGEQLFLWLLLTIFEGGKS